MKEVKETAEIQSPLAQAEIAFEDHLRQGTVAEGIECAWGVVVHAARVEVSQGGDRVAILDRLTGLAAFATEKAASDKDGAMALLFDGRARALGEIATIFFVEDNHGAPLIPHD